MSVTASLLDIKKLYPTPACSFLFICQVELGVFFHTLNTNLPPLPSALYSFSQRICSSAAISHLSSFIPQFSLLISPSRVLLLQFQQPDGLCLCGWAADISVSSFPRLVYFALTSSASSLPPWPMIRPYNYFILHLSYFLLSPVGFSFLFSFYPA